MILRAWAVLALLLMPSLAQAAQGSESRYAPMDGILIHYQSWGKGEPAILIHGFTLDGSFWRHQVPVLAKTLDLPGHGDSGKPADVQYSMDYYARAVEAVAKDAGIDHAALVGHSMGLPIIHSVLRRGMLKVDKVAFIDGAILAPPADAAARAAQEAWLKTMLEGLRGPNYQLVLEQFFLTFTTKVQGRQKRELLDKVRAIDQSVAVSTFEHFGDAPVWAPARYDVPALGLYAAQSRQGVKEWLAATYPRARLVVWDDVDHFPQLTQPLRVNKALVEFLGAR